ncbi:hypothetical protein CIHG_09190 [Coccidioides immitis H538.4]|uniref:Uncharacterized protein n=3 Tax=Coccidioides immitis TaxID=5501 RepID=A0A0J8R617_COCIT|nr:hypothetical protein CIRG_05946 [Coccidioides immitis RMSCC 2394]KMU80529.1 hypothetical protein CISG_02380 [Coccidioides immitis RMSCC 3703]KMU91313.1 hypothetical protein CIHG_09190 [Coccidioides immitis H538.4]
MDGPDSPEEIRPEWYYGSKACFVLAYSIRLELKALLLLENRPLSPRRHYAFLFGERAIGSVASKRTAAGERGRLQERKTRERRRRGQQQLEREPEPMHLDSPSVELMDEAVQQAMMEDDQNRTALHMSQHQATGEKFLP